MFDRVRPRLCIFVKASFYASTYVSVCVHSPTTSIYNSMCVAALCVLLFPHVRPCASVRGCVRPWARLSSTSQARELGPQASPRPVPCAASQQVLRGSRGSSYSSSLDLLLRAEEQEARGRAEPGGGGRGGGGGWGEGNGALNAVVISSFEHKRSFCCCFWCIEGNVDEKVFVFFAFWMTGERGCLLNVMFSSDELVVHCGKVKKSALCVHRKRELV